MLIFKYYLLIFLSFSMLYPLFGQGIDNSINYQEFGLSLGNSIYSRNMMLRVDNNLSDKLGVYGQFNFGKRNVFDQRSRYSLLVINSVGDTIPQLRRFSNSTHAKFGSIQLGLSLNVIRNLKNEFSFHLGVGYQLYENSVNRGLIGIARINYKYFIGKRFFVGSEFELHMSSLNVRQTNQEVSSITNQQVDGLLLIGYRFNKNGS